MCVPASVSVPVPLSLSLLPPPRWSKRADDSLPSGVSFWQGDFRVHIYRLSHDGPEQEMIDGAGEDEEIAACDQWILPAASLEGVSCRVVSCQASDYER